MSKELYKSKWDESTQLKSEGKVQQALALRAEAKAHAEQYCIDNAARLETIYGNLTLPQIVSQIDFYRSQGRFDDVQEADMWLLANFEPQKIGGTMDMSPKKKVK